MVHNDAKKEAREPEDGRQERESLSSVPLSASVAAAEGDAVPGPDASTVDTAIVVNQDTKGGEPGG